MEKILCIGLGKLGLTFAQTLAKNNIVFGFDLDKKIYLNVKKNIRQIEPNLNNLIKANKKRFSLVYKFNNALRETSCVFIILPTPSQKNNNFDNRHIIKALDSLGSSLKNKKKYYIIITSTVNPGSCNFFIKHLEKKFGLKHGKEFVLCYNPHLIALGSIYSNIMNSDVVIVGSDIEDGHNFLYKFYLRIYKKNISKLKFLNLKEAEISKIAINSFVTLKISYSNTLSQISDTEKNIDTSKILDAVGSDSRIGKKYLSLGALFSGPCFPRDNLNFVNYLKKNKVKIDIPLATDAINNYQINRYIKIFNDNKKYINEKITVGICGISYKSNTSLSTLSPGYLLAKKLRKNYDVVVHEKQKPKIDFNVNYIKNIKNFYIQSNVIFICYPDKSFKKIETFKCNKKKVIIDLWNFLKKKNKNIILNKIGVSKYIK
jgi:UDPglucose 6-dehydrogenase